MLKVYINIRSTSEQMYCGEICGVQCIGACPPRRTQFFHFCIHFHQKAPALEVHVPLMGNPGSATVAVADPGFPVGGGCRAIGGVLTSDMGTFQ